MWREDQVQGGRNGTCRCKCKSCMLLLLFLPIFVVGHLLVIVSIDVFLDADPKNISLSKGGGGGGGGDDVSSSPASAHVNKFSNPYDVGYLLSLVRQSTAFDVGFGTPLDVGMSYYRPMAVEATCCLQPKRHSANEEGSQVGSRRRRSTGKDVRFHHRIMIYRSLPHPTCLAALLLHHYKDVATALETTEDLRGKTRLILSHDLKIQDDHGGMMRPFPAFLNTTDAVHRITKLFSDQRRNDERHSSSSLAYDALVHCRKVAGVKRAPSRHPRDAVFFNLADVFYAGGRFVLLVDEKNSSNKEGTRDAANLVWIPSQISSTLPLQQEVLADAETKLVLEQSVIPAARAAAAAATIVRVRSLVKVRLRFGAMFPFVKGSWPQHTRDTLQLFIALVQKGHKSVDGDGNRGDVARYSVGYFQPPTDFQVPHHSLIETVLPSFMSQQHFLRAHARGRRALGRYNRQGWHALAITSRPYYTINGRYSRDGCRLSFERCLTNGPWGDIYVGQLQQFAAVLRQRQQSCTGESTEEMCEDSQGGVSVSSSSPLPRYVPVNILPRLHQQHWVYGLREEETQFRYIEDELHHRVVLRNSRRSGQTIALVDAPIGDGQSPPVNSSSQPVFHLQHLLVGYPTHCEPLFGPDPLYADMVDTLFRHIMPHKFNTSYYEDFLESLPQLILQQQQQQRRQRQRQMRKTSSVGGAARGPSVQVWMEWLALFYVSYMDCQAHLRQFREMHFSRALLDLLREKGKVMDSGDGGNVTLVLPPARDEGPASSVVNLLRHIAVKAAISSTTTITSDASAAAAYMNKTYTSPLSDALRFLLTPPPPPQTTTTTRTRGGEGGKWGMEKAAQPEQLGEENSIANADDIFIFYSSRRGDWARNVVNEDLLLQRLPRDVAIHINGKPALKERNRSVKGWRQLLRRVHLRMARFHANLSHGRQLFEQMEVHRTTIFIGAPGANLLNSLFLRPTSGVVTFSFGPMVNKVFYPTSVFPQHAIFDFEKSHCAVLTRGLLWRSVALKQTCNPRIRSRKCRMGSDNINDFLLDEAGYRRIVDAVVDIVREQDKLRRINCPQ